jgi:hypothetical protein
VSGFLRGWSQDEFPEEDGKPARPYPVMLLDTPNGEKEMGLTLADLKAQVFAAKPKIGDMVLVKYLRDGKPKLFHVEVTPAVAEAPLSINPRPAEATAFPPVQDVAPF